LKEVFLVVQLFKNNGVDFLDLRISQFYFSMGSAVECHLDVARKKDQVESPEVLFRREVDLD
jgi:hypothetical protein